MCRLAYGPADAICHSLSLATVKSRLVLPFWYRLTPVVLDNGPLNGCVWGVNKISIYLSIDISTCSGLMYISVPCLLVRCSEQSLCWPRSLVVSTDPSVITVARPKSLTFTCPVLSSNSMFCGWKHAQTKSNNVIVASRLRTPVSASLASLQR